MAAFFWFFVTRSDRCERSYYENAQIDLINLRKWSERWKRTQPMNTFIIIIIIIIYFAKHINANDSDNIRFMRIFAVVFKI